MSTIYAALLGLGTVGTGAYKILNRQKEQLPHKIGAGVEIKKVLVRDLEKASKKVEDASVLTNDWKSILNDDSISIIIEVMGGMEPARTYIMEALKAGKHVVTANKDLIAENGKELLDEAKARSADLLFEAAVAGGIPIIRPLKQCLAGNNIEVVMGIVNGTTNFILSKMTEEGMEFDEALALAGRLGYAEADPTADIEGYDAGRKMAIMASIAFQSRVTFEDVYTEGITKITATDISYAGEMGCTIKLIGIARNTDTGIEVRVHPMLIPSDHPLSSVKDSFNAVFVKGDAVGETMFFGRGAGEMPTASAIVGDVLDIVRNIQYDCNGRISCTCYKDTPIKKLEDSKSRYFLRMQVENRPGVLASIASVFGNNAVSIEQIIQKHKKNELAEIVAMTESVKEGHFNDSLAIFKGMTAIREISSVIRVYGE